DQGTYQHDSHPMMVQQNKWRATRFGNRAMLVDTFNYEIASVEQMVNRLATMLRPTAEELHCESYLDHCQVMAQNPSAAQRQLDIRAETDDPREVVRRLTEAARVSGAPV
ncbi:MAG TPA: glutamate--cysteine ligase, partial [Pirellulaceae bacterium]